MTATPPTNDTILFRPSKKRKVYRQRIADNDDELPSTNFNASAPSPVPATIETEAQSLDELISSTAGAATGVNDQGGDVEGVRVSMAEILRLRKRNKKFGGVEFRAGSGHILRDGDGTVVVRGKVEGDRGDAEGGEGEGGLLAGNGVPRKFAPQTGTVGDVNKHMMAYIDSQLAKRRVEGSKVTNTTTSAGSATISTATSTHASRSIAPGQVPDSTKAGKEVQRQPATLGKLLEIDLGDEARSRNVERTDKARRKLDGEVVVEEEEGGKKVKVRLGRDGKPWRPRKRRASDDIKRDNLVDEVLRENRLEIYDEPVVEPESVNDDQAADDRIAEAFRKEFMDAVSQRQRKKAGPAPPPVRTAAGKKEEEVLKGPKLGGSRNARAAMRDSMLKAAKK